MRCCLINYHLVVYGSVRSAFKMSRDVAAVWDIELSDGVYRIEFEHGTTTGKRVIYINGKVCEQSC